MKYIIPLLLLLTLFGVGCGRTNVLQTPVREVAAPVPASVTTPSNLAKPQFNMLSKPAMQIDKTKTYTAVLKTSAGDITITLNAAATPATVNNFVYLARNDFYDGIPFHRAISGFMIQGGDPKGDGTGGPGYRFDDEPFAGEYKRGTVAMANAGPNTNGSQFFIMHQDYPLPRSYVIFGSVVAGLEVIDKIANAPVTFGVSGEKSKPVNPVYVEDVEIIEQ